jgi:cell wall-associated NlpC family hydrolase
MRKKPAHTAELVNQVLMGRIVSLLKAKNNWCYVQSDDGYLGWMTTGSLRLCNKQECEEWGAADRIAYIQLNGVIYSEMSETAMPISDVVLGNIMRRLETIRTGSARVWQEWVKVALPDGRQGFLPKSTVAELGEIFPKTPTLAQRLVATAQRCLGIPFLWGGNSAHGFDAAGFVQTVFSLNGVQLLRDADQQARDGKPVEIGSRFNELRPADLLFFGSRADQIDHVGISLGGPRFFHTRDFVQISSLDPNDADYNSELRDRFQFVRRHFEEIASISSHGKL